MKKSTQEKSLITINNESIFYKLKQFLKNLFHRDKIIENTHDMEESKNINEDNMKTDKIFQEYTKNIEDEEAKLLKLQKRYRSGEIKEEELTEEQVESLCALYDNQIERLRKSNEMRKQKLLKYRKKLQTIKNIEDEEEKLLKLQKRYRSGEIKEEELTEEQVKSLCALYDNQIERLRKSNEMRKQKLLKYRKKLQTDN